MHGVHSEITHHTDLAARSRLPFPVGGFGGVEIATVQEACSHLQHPSERARLDVLNCPLRTGCKGEF